MRRKEVYIRPVQLYLYSRYDVQRGGRLNPTDVSSVKKKKISQTPMLKRVTLLHHFFEHSWIRRI